MRISVMPVRVGAEFVHVSAVLAAAGK
jgi:hypothetical protein